VWDVLVRAGVSASVERIPEGYNRVRYALPDPAPLVSIIVPTRNALALVRTCLESLLRETEYAPYEVLLIDNQSDDAEALAYFAALAERPEVRLIRYDAPFNFAAINNFGAAAARGSVLVLLNNDIEITQRDWLAELVRYASRPQNGVVGAKLLYPDQTIQHAGVVVGFGGVAGHIGIREPRNYPGQMSRCRIAQNLTGVTAACLAVRKAVYEEAGGMDAASLGIAFNDIDLCLKVAALGYRNVWTPHVELVHRESATRGHEDTPEKQARFAQEIEFMQRKWGDALMQDPAYNPNLDLERQPFALAFPPRVALVPD
jgi:GT2 family glycosyltransferase